LRARDPGAERWLLETHAGLVERIIVRVIGDVRNLEDNVQEVFVRVFARASEIRDPGALKAYVTSVAVFVAREVLRKRRRHAWLRFFAPEELPEPAAATDPESREALLAVYRVLSEMDVDVRISFALRYIEGMDLAQVAAATGRSLATVKRRLMRAEEVFVARCRDDETLRPWLEAGSRWA
ncbi:MAG: sigma-70 family RNA polymerase sigma factor, partial [Polyangiaceae bacterium]|nr:sigma-70 family RNA polymerase sigma factor [Polyangiaceae bacterium]